METSKKIIETIVPDEVYTDRQEHIDFFYYEALKGITRRTMSTVLLGQRRMGKTEIFKRVVNRLFFEQDLNRKYVIPVFFQFPEEIISRNNFAIIYVDNFLRWYTAFLLRDYKILHYPKSSLDLIELINKRINKTFMIETAIDLLKGMLDKQIVMPEQKALMIPREVAFRDDITIAMFLDEFQNTRLPHLNFSIVGFFQEAVESPTCPHFVTGSAMSILKDEILGKGALYGRFDYERIEQFTDYYGEELAIKAARYYGASIQPEMSPIISDRCGGNPFYITAIVKQAGKQKKKINNEKNLNQIMAIDITSGFIWMELSDQVNRWIHRINEYGITKWILYLAANEEGKEIDLYRIQQELKIQESKDVPISKIKEIMVKLARGDLLEYKEFGNWFGKINDPILNEFLKVWGAIEVARYNRKDVYEKTIRKFEKLEKRFHDHKGYLAEVYMNQILWNSQNTRLSHKFFNTSKDIDVPGFIYIDQRYRQHMGKKIEIDLYASSGTEIWLAESKYQQKPVGKNVIQHMLKQKEIVLEREGDDLEKLTLWLFSYAGVTSEAYDLIKKNGILWSSKDDLNALLEHVGLRKLPPEIA